jgi:hypothetical protein
MEADKGVLIVIRIPGFCQYGSFVKRGREKSNLLTFLDVTTSHIDDYAIHLVNVVSLRRLLEKTVT